MIKLNGNVITQDNFPDGTLLMKILTSTEHNNLIEWKYENDAELFTLICLKRYIDDNNADTACYLHMYYLPHARQDRVKNQEDVFTLKYFCEIINSLKFNGVTVKDVHSNVSLALLDRVANISAKWHIIDAIDLIPDENKLILFYPDEGAVKRYSDNFIIPYAFGIKKRNWETGAIEGLELAGSVDQIAGSDILIIDDICSRGGTFYHSAKALKEAGAANIYLYVTHCENTIHEGELLKNNGLIERIYTTNSLITKYHDKITIV